MTWKEADYRMILAYSLLFLFIALMTAVFFIMYTMLTVSPELKADCYVEHGKIVDAWIKITPCRTLFLKYKINNHMNTVWFECDSGENLNLSKENIALRWCYIKEVGGYRVRGAWTY